MTLTDHERTLLVDALRCARAMALCDEERARAYPHTCPAGAQQTAAKRERELDALRARVEFER
jgi:hypothetical protein